jgi:hypothetical protein
MKSPFTGGNAILKTEKAELEFRKEKFQYISSYYLCEDTKERFTTTEIDTANLSQAYNQYRVKYGIPFPDEIKKIRRMYDLPASKMSKILGFGDNQYRLYENGDIPSEANGKILNLIKNPEVFRTFVENAKNQFEVKDYEKLLTALHKVSMNDHKIEEKMIFSTSSRGLCNGYATQSYDKLRSTILFLLDRCGRVFNTKMNKLLFYTDFLSYKTYGKGITGLSYKAIQYGPVPLRWDRVYSLIDGVESELVEFNSGVCGTELHISEQPDLEELTPQEIGILNIIVDKFKDMSSAEISVMSHKEDAWKEYHDCDNLISYNEAFKLSTI